MTLQEAYKYCIDILSANNIDEFDFKSLCLVCSIADIKNSEYHYFKNKNIDSKSLKDCLNRIINGEPLQYVLGKWEFFESEFYVGEGVLIPRPETEELVEYALEMIRNIRTPIVYDLCSGSGCIGISIAKKFSNAKVFCVEKSEKAFSYLMKNAADIPNVVCINDDINNDIQLPLADLIVSNPPYIKTEQIPFLQNEVKKEPLMALDGGADGMDFYRLIHNKWCNKLKKAGVLLLEIGEDQGNSIKTVLSNFQYVHVVKDMYDNDRIVIAKDLIKV